VRARSWLLAVVFLAALAAAVAVPIAVYRLGQAEKPVLPDPQPPDTADERTAAAVALEFARRLRAREPRPACELTGTPLTQELRCDEPIPRIPGRLRIASDAALDVPVTRTAGASVRVLVRTAGATGRTYELQRLGGSWRVTGVDGAAGI